MFNDIWGLAYVIGTHGYMDIRINNIKVLVTGLVMPEGLGCGYC